MGADNSIVSILEGKTTWVVKKMAKNKNNQLKKEHNTALPKADVEFAEERGNGLEKVALKAQKSHNK